VFTRTALVLAVVVGLLLGFALSTISTPREGPRLIAQGCHMAGGDLWASEESDFPTNCDHIEPWEAG